MLLCKVSILSVIFPFTVNTEFELVRSGASLLPARKDEDYASSLLIFLFAAKIARYCRAAISFAVEEGQFPGCEKTHDICARKALRYF